MSTPSPDSDSGHPGPHTPSRGQPPSGKYAKSSPVGKVPKYFLPENRDQYQKFGHDERSMLGAFKNKTEFLQFLRMQHIEESKEEFLESIPDVPSRGMEYFLDLANKVAKFIHDKREHYLFLYLAFLPTYDFHFRLPRVLDPTVPENRTQITTWTRYGHKVQARHHRCPG